MRDWQALAFRRRYAVWRGACVSPQINVSRQFPCSKDASRRVVEFLWRRGRFVM